jgi:hypothetical protein
MKKQLIKNYLLDNNFTINKIDEISIDLSHLFDTKGDEDLVFDFLSNIKLKTSLPIFTSINYTGENDEQMIVEFFFQLPKTIKLDDIIDIENIDHLNIIKIVELLNSF